MSMPKAIPNSLDLILQFLDLAVSSVSSALDMLRANGLPLELGNMSAGFEKRTPAPPAGCRRFGNENS